MTELSMSSTRKRLRKDKEISDEDLIPKTKKLYLGAPSDSNGIYIIVDIYLVNSIS